MVSSDLLKNKYSLLILGKMLHFGYLGIIYKTDFPPHRFSKLGLQLGKNEVKFGGF